MSSQVLPECHSHLPLKQRTVHSLLGQGELNKYLPHVVVGKSGVAGVFGQGCLLVVCHVYVLLQHQAHVIYSVSTEITPWPQKNQWLFGSTSVCVVQGCWSVNVHCFTVSQRGHSLSGATNLISFNSRVSFFLIPSHSFLVCRNARHTALCRL